jgi:inorganic phosphate transporter, PiT family
MEEVFLVFGIAAALAFDFTNGFHDTANAVATSVSTRALTPRLAVVVASVANLAGAFVTTAVATTIGQDIVSSDLITTRTIVAGLLGAIAWNLLTWWFGLPSSSSHALIGGLVVPRSLSPAPRGCSGTGSRTRWSSPPSSLR